MRDKKDADNSVRISGLRAGIMDQEKLALAEESVEYKMQQHASKKHVRGWDTGLAGSRLHQPGFVRHRPSVERFPKVGDNRFVNVPTVGVDLWVHMSMRTEGKC